MTSWENSGHLITLRLTFIAVTHTLDVVSSKTQTETQVQGNFKRARPQPSTERAQIAPGTEADGSTQLGQTLQFIPNTGGVAC